MQWSHRSILLPNHNYHLLLYFMVPASTSWWAITFHVYAKALRTSITATSCNIYTYRVVCVVTLAYSFGRIAWTFQLFTCWRRSRSSRRKSSIWQRLSERKKLHKKLSALKACRIFTPLNCLHAWALGSALLYLFPSLVLSHANRLSHKLSSGIKSILSLSPILPNFPSRSGFSLQHVTPYFLTIHSTLHSKCFTNSYGAQALNYLWCTQTLIINNYGLLIPKLRNCRPYEGSIRIVYSLLTLYAKFMRYLRAILPKNNSEHNIKCDNCTPQSDWPHYSPLLSAYPAVQYEAGERILN